MPKFEVFTEVIDDYECVCGSKVITLDAEYNHYVARCQRCRAVWTVWEVPKPYPKTKPQVQWSTEQLSATYTRFLSRGHERRTMEERTMDSIAEHELRDGCRKLHESCASLVEKGMINPAGYCTSFVDYTVPKSKW